MCLLVKETKPVGANPNEWRVKHQIDLLKEAAKKPVNTFQMKERGKSVLVTLNKEVSEPNILKTLLQNKLGRFTNLETNAADKKNAVVDCIGEDDATEVAVLLQVEITDARVSQN